MSNTNATASVPDVKLHPLQARRRPGPQGADAPLQVEVDLVNAGKIIDLVEAGVLATETPSAPLMVPCDATGRPLRRLTPEDERELSFRIQTFGDVDARNTLVLANVGLVHLMANQMRRNGVRYDDLVQEGTLGLMRATETFDPGRGVRFSTYCVYWIRAKIQRYLQRLDRDDMPSIPGAHMQEDERGQRRRPRARRLSLDGPIDEGEDRTLGDTVATPVEDPERSTLRTEREQAVDRVLWEIADELGDPRLRTIIERRLLAEDPDTLAVIGEELSLSREGARLLEGKVLRLARQRLSAMQLSATP